VDGGRVQNGRGVAGGDHPLNVPHRGGSSGRSHQVSGKWCRRVVLIPDSLDASLSVGRGYVDWVRRDQER
jgi:hypothetical protein